MSTSAPANSVDRPKRGPNPRLVTLATLVAIPDLATGGTARLLNLSTSGACVELDAPLEPGQSLEVKLAHPRLGVVPTLAGEVKWLETAEEKTRAGLQFHEPSEANRAVRPFLTAEAGSCLLEDGSLVGFLVPHGKAKTTWSIFEASGKRLAVASLTKAGFEVSAKTPAGQSFQAASLHEAARQTIGAEEPLKLDPPVPGWRKAIGEPTPQVAEPAPQIESVKFENALGRAAPRRIKTSSSADLDHPPIFVTSQTQAPRPAIAAAVETLPEPSEQPRVAAPRRSMGRGHMLLSIPLLVVAGYLVYAIQLLVAAYTN